MVLLALAALGIGGLAGNFGVVLLNHLPDIVFCHPMAHVAGYPPGTQRVKSVPWKVILGAAFSGVYFYVGLQDPFYAAQLVCLLFTLGLLVLVVWRWGELPTPLLVALLLSDITAGQFRSSVATMLAGAILGTVCLALCALVGRKQGHYVVSRQGLLAGIVGLALGLPGMLLVLLASGFTVLTVQLASPRRRDNSRKKTIRSENQAEDKGKALQGPYYHTLVFHLLCWSAVYLVAGCHFNQTLEIWMGTWLPWSLF